MRALRWAGTAVGWLGCLVALIAFGGAGVVLLRTPKCPPDAPLCTENVGIVVAGGCWLGLIALVVSSVGFAIRGLAAKRSTSRRMT